EISRVAHEYENRIRENETFRVTVEKRFTETSTRSIIEAIASKINRKVDLEKPDKIVLVEVIGGLTGMSLIKPEDVLSVTKEKAL
ncbi:MAG: THUMP domain-containing protein, partial [Candidatus Bathyarchaeia archaeon]